MTTCSETLMLLQYVTLGDRDAALHCGSEIDVIGNRFRQSLASFSFGAFAMRSAVR